MALLLFIATGTTLLNAQKQYIYLNNGSVIKGKIIYTENQDLIKIRSAGNIFVYNRQDIDTIIYKATGATSPLEFNNFFRVGTTVLIGNRGNEEPAPVAFQVSYNHSVYNNISAGIGAGMEYYKETTFIPAFANFEYRFRNTRFSPFVYLKCGYLFAANESIQTETPVYYDPVSSIAPWPAYKQMELSPHGGFLINPGIGFNVMISDNFGFGLGVGYRYHKIGYYGDNGYSLDYQYNRLSIDIGIIFK